MLISPAQAQAVLSKSAYWQRLEAANRSFADEFFDLTAVGRRLDGDRTSFTSDSEKRNRNSNDDQRCSATGICGIAIGS